MTGRSLDELLPADDAEAILLLKGAVVELDGVVAEGMDGDQPHHVAAAAVAIAQVGLYLGRRATWRGGGYPIDLEPGVEAVGLRWYTCPDGTVIGFVGLIDRNAADPFFKVYIGIAGGGDVERDTARIAHSGHPLLDEVMARHLVGEHYAFAGLRYEF